MASTPGRVWLRDLPDLLHSLEGVEVKRYWEAGLGNPDCIELMTDGYSVQAHLSNMDDQGGGLDLALERGFFVSCVETADFDLKRINWFNAKRGLGSYAVLASDGTHLINHFDVFNARMFAPTVSVRELLEYHLMRFRLDLARFTAYSNEASSQLTDLGR